MTIFEQLEEEHFLLKRLMTQIARTKLSDLAGRKSLFKKFELDLLAHGKAEEEQFYSILEDDEDIYEQIENAKDEHHRFEGMLRKLAEMDMGNEEWIKSFKELQDEVVNHIEEEEETIFPEAKHILDENEYESLASNYLKRENEFRNNLLNLQ